MLRVVFASGNRHKYEEMCGLLREAPLRLEFHATALAVEENGSTYEDNALLKARAWAGATRMPTLSDDSGLEVEALDGAPGLRSARVASTAEARIGWLLNALDGIQNRRAKFVAALAMVFPDGREYVARGECFGRIAESVSGKGGFGYDPVFIPDGEEKTFAELGDHYKARVSHRARACRALWDVLTTNSVVEYTLACSQ